MMLSGWGRFPRLDCRTVEPCGRDDLASAIVANDSLIAHGNGRAYGDAALNPKGTLLMRGYREVLSFDQKTGRLTCEAGLMLSEIIERFVPLGWHPPVAPGTKFVTVGGMIAADIHGKNHHCAGSFGRYVESIKLVQADGTLVQCSRQENSELFAATCGGMGLTGVILEATFSLVPIETSLIRRETLRARNLEEAMEQFADSEGWTYSVAWIDCLARERELGRSVLYRGEHARREDVQAAGREASLELRSRSTWRIPVDFPAMVLNRWNVRAFNAIYYRRAREGTDIVEFDPFFYPLDVLREWNRIYGSTGFIEYQCVLPIEASPLGIALLLRKIRDGGGSSFLSVLKRFGPQEGPLSFPMAGYTLALDFRADAPSLRLAQELDAIVSDHGGRIYLAKDARMSAAMLRRGYPGLDRFLAIRAAVDPKRKFASLQSRRLGL